MTIRVDPEGNETSALFDLVELEGREVLEIGCGDGRLTWRYADRAAHVTAIEPFEGSIARARERLRGTNLPVEFRHVSFEDYAADTDADAFDVTLLSWSLCCMVPEGMVDALEEIHRLLKSAGTLIEIHPAIAPPPFVEVRSGEDVSFSEEDPAFDYADDSRHAEAAVATVAERGMFAVDEPRPFELRTHAASVAEMRDYWSVYDAYDPEAREESLVRRKDEMYERASAAMGRSPGSEIVFVEPAMMTRLTAF